MEPQRKDNSLKVRFDAATLSLLEQAGSRIGMDRSKFVRFSVRSTAEAVITQHEKTAFSKGDWITFFNMVDDQEPKPTRRLKKAAHKYKEIISISG